MKLLVLDGGMGTTLETLGHDVSGPMWGCELVDKDPQVIRDVHRRFVDAGADLIETATYQLTVPALEEAGYTPTTSSSVLQKAVSLTDMAKPNGVVLSLGPFGATLRPGQEYSGFYPPPYGPRGLSEGSNTNYATSPADVELYELALAQFHLNRLRAYASDSTTWSRIQWIAFETVPSLAEVRGIRRAMGQLFAEVGRKPFWIASAYPGGKHGQMDADGGAVSMDTIVESLVGGGLDVPDGIGINCTNPAYIQPLAREMTAALASHGLSRKPMFVLYPDGGSVYDVVTRTWTSEGVVSPEGWAKSVVSTAREALESGEWAGAVVGGCCKSSFAEIGALRKEVDGRE